MQDYAIQAEFEENYLYAKDYWDPFVSDALVFTLAAAGSTWVDDERKALAKEGREPIEFNIIRRPIEFFSGFLRDNLNSIVISPVEGSDEETATQFTKLSYYVWDKGNGYKVFLDACDEMFKSGISLVGVHMDYSKDFINGDISFYKRTFNSFYLDPTFESLDLSDSGFLITRDIVTPSEVKKLLKDIDSKDLEDIPNTYRDDKFRTFRPKFTNMSRGKDLIAYDQYYRRTTRMREFLVDRNTDFFRDITDLTKEKRDKLESGIHRLRKLREDSEGLGINEADIPNVEIMNVERPFVELNVMLNGQRVYAGIDHTGIAETYPCVPIVCYFEPSIWLASRRIQGIAASEYSNQRQFNKRHMKIQDMFDSVISTGYKYLIGSVPDPSDMQQSGQNKLIGVDPDNAPQGLDSVQELRGGNVPPALMEYAKMLDELSLTLANVNESVLGIDEKGNTQVSGRLAQVRIAQGLRSNRKIFDNIEVSQELVGGLVLKTLQNTYSPGKIERILGEKPTQQFYDKEFEQFDSQVKEGIRSKSQKDAYYNELLVLKREELVDVPQAEIIRALQMSGIDDLQEAIEKQQEQEAIQQQKVDAQEIATLELINADKESKLALAQVRRAREHAELGLKEERASEAEENRAQAGLARAKTITEIATMEDDRILKVLEFVSALDEQEKRDRDEVANRISAEVDQLNSETEGSAEHQQKTAVQQAAVQQTSPQGSLLDGQ